MSRASVTVAVSTAKLLAVPPEIADPTIAWVGLRSQSCGLDLLKCGSDSRSHILSNEHGRENLHVVDFASGERRDESIRFPRAANVSQNQIMGKCPDGISGRPKP